MRVALTGSTGFVGSHVLTDLVAHGHEVTALVRNDEEAEAVRARGAIPAEVDLYDRPAVAKLFPARMAPFTPRVRATRRVPTSTPPCSKLRSTRTRPAGSPTSRSAVCGSTGTTPTSPKPRRTTPRRGGVEGTTPTTSARPDGHARDLRPVGHRLRRRRRGHPRDHSRLTA